MWFSDCLVAEPSCVVASVFDLCVIFFIYYGVVSSSVWSS